MEPWQSKLAQGDAQGAWDLFAERYRRLILATIKRLVPDHDDVMDVYSTVCQALAAKDCARLKRYSNYSDQSARRASVATWTVIVVRNLTVDWLRQQEGRRRVSIPTNLSALGQAIYRAVCIEGCSHVEAYEMIRARTALTLSFPEFLREVRVTHRIAPCPRNASVRRAVLAPESDDINNINDINDVHDVTDVAAPALDPAEAAELASRLAGALASQPPDVRLAVELFVIERASAADVARVVGWPNAKAVYNRVYRALEALRAGLVREGIGPGDLG